MDLFAVPSDLAVTEEEAVEFHSESAGKAIEQIGYEYRERITGPEGYEINVRVLHSGDPDMVLVEVVRTTEPKIAHSLYAVDWDDIAPREMLDESLDAAPTAQHVGVILSGLVAEANRVLAAMAVA